MKPKYALVTGVSRRLGLGFAVARQLAELNYHVILTARDVRQAEERGDDDEERSPAEAAKGVVWAATLDNDGPTGGLFFDGKPVSETAR